MLHDKKKTSVLIDILKPLAAALTCSITDKAFTLAIKHKIQYKILHNTTTGYWLVLNQRQ